MAAASNGRINFLKDKQEAKKASSDLKLWFKKIGRLFRRADKKVSDLQLKHDISHLEKQRTKEHTELLRQRKFYENLLKQKKENLAPPVKNKINELGIHKSNLLNKELSISPKTEDPKPIVEQVTPEIKEVPLPTQKPSHESTEIKASSQDIILPSTSSQIVEPEITSTKASFKLDQTKISNGKKLIRSKNNGFKKFNIFKTINQTVKHSSLAKKLAQEREAEEAVRHKKDVEERFWQPYNSVKANLIKDQGLVFFNWQQKLLTLFLSLLLCSLAISLVYVGLLIWQRERLNDNKTVLANYEAINAEVLKSEGDIKEIVDFNKKLEIVSLILNNHVYWTNFLAFLEDNTLKDVYYSSFSGDLSGSYSLPSFARNLDTISLQLEVMKSYKMMKTVQYNSSQSIPAVQDRPAMIKFNLDISLDPRVFIK